MTFKRELICSYKDHKIVSSRYPKRVVLGHSACPNGSFYYFGKDGQVRQVYIEDNTIWACDYENPPFMKRIR